MSDELIWECADVLRVISRILRLDSVKKADDTEELCREAESLQRTGDLGRAEVKFKAILASNPGNWRAVTAMAALSLQVGNEREAIALYDEALKQRPQHAESHYKRANAYNRLNELDTALAGYDQAIAYQPSYANAYCNRGTVLEKLGRLPDALLSYDQAIALNPHDAFAHYNRASVLKTQRRYGEALESYDRALNLNTAYVEAQINKGLVLQELFRYEEAVSCFDRAILIDAGYVEPWEGKASCFLGLRRVPDAIAAFDRALSLRSDRPYLLGLRLNARMQICDWNGYAESIREIEAGVLAGRKVTTPFAALSLFDSPELHRLAAEIWVADVCSAGPVLDVPRPTAGGRIRIGYFSPDFRTHPVASLLIEVLERHDHSKFELVAFDFGPFIGDGMRDRLMRSFDRVEDVRALPDEAVASLARDLRIDIAVDLAGFTEHNRARVFSFKPAPVQINYLGYPGTAGNAAIDFVIGDPQVTPNEFKANYAEKILHLPQCFLPVPAFGVKRAAPARADVGLPSMGFVFCAFNNFYKINPTIFDVWMRILHSVDSAVLWLPAAGEPAMQNLFTEARRRGIDPERLIFASRMPSHADHIARLGLADLFLDTTPYGAHATAIDALSAALPFLTCRGRSFASRVGASLLTAFGLPEMITENLKQYENKAVELAQNPGQLRALSYRLKQFSCHAEETLSLERYTAALEALYIDLVRNTLSAS